MPCHANVMLHKVLWNLNALTEIIKQAYLTHFLWCWLKSIKQLYIKNWKISILYQYQNTKKLQLYLLSIVILYTANEEFFLCTVSLIKKKKILENYSFSKTTLKYCPCLTVFVKQPWTIPHDKRWSQWNVK